ncbi:MAG: YraN family protein [Cyclobacteriaceae bacterium]|nr:YraN family protein [Cyclobacteriaceae bacterium]
MSDKIEKGKAGEDLAAQFLIDKGYQVLARNYRFKRSEIDLIAQKDNCLVFVEVKLRTTDAFGYPEEFVNEKKAGKIMEGADQYIYELKWKGNIRFDIVAIRQIKGKTELVQIEDAFY